MQRLCYSILLAGILAACGTSTTQQQETTTAEQGAITAIASSLPGDPVCEMPYDTSYQEWSVYKGDTVYFCSPTCKGVFDKNPEKYAANLKQGE
ncbi:YHS domain-containing protein [Chitinophaga japonensis]|uniref:YHS domain-containing protein n=1 Tax=Chitinophaga japonensis TaxID=104662 RepID=A0A562TCA0_CHIJA|nr:YHS domain-containing protein [Chitinophaga japonensis]TWI91181.1 YHS domain-containing protein [Chitinophaga japonensis]